MHSLNEVSLEEFHERLSLTAHISDPYQRLFQTGIDKNTQRRVIVKEYVINSSQQEEAIIDNLQNYITLRRVQGLSQILCFTWADPKRLQVAFDFHEITLEELFQSLTSEERGYTFLVELLRQVTRLMSELKEEEVEIDDVRPSNLVVEGPKDRYVFRLFYDERQKNKFLDMRGLYISQERIEEWQTGNIGAYYFEDKLVYECGLMLLDLATYEIQETLYLKDQKPNIKVVNRKLEVLHKKYPETQLPRIVSRMLNSIPSERPTLSEVSHSCEVLSTSEFPSSKSLSQVSFSHAISRSNFETSVHSTHILQPTHIVQPSPVVTSRSQLDFLVLNGNTHPSVQQELHMLKSKLECLTCVHKKYQDGSVYHGELVEGSREGLGMYAFAHGDIFFGHWEGNSPRQGTYIFQSGETYEGGMRNGKHGKGIYRYANGNIYEGYWEEDLKEGHGSMVYSNGDSYEGAWRKGKKEGYGMFQYSNGIRYEGTFLHGNKSGECRILFPDQTRFEGNWEDCSVEGFGRMEYQNGDTFEGNFSQSMKHGLGVVRWSNNATYEGQLEQDSLSGRCLVHYNNDEFYEGTVVEGLKSGEGVYHYSNGDIFSGIWKQDFKHQGRYSFVDGSVFEGSFKNNDMRSGSMVYLNGDIYQGEFKNGHREGKGKYHLGDGTFIEGQWLNDAFIRG